VKLFRWFFFYPAARLQSPTGYLTFRFRSDLSNIIDYGLVQIPSSRSHRPSQSPAGERRRRTRGRGRDEVGRLEREIFFYEGIWVFLLKERKRKRRRKKTEEKKKFRDGFRKTV
jgi:hypothetical protein